MSNHSNEKRGIDLSDQKAHEVDHKKWSRRSFLQSIGLAGATSFSLNLLPITSMYGFPLSGAFNNDFPNRKLVLIRLKGGNDGLNTIVPLFDYDTYKSERPTLAHHLGDLINLNEEFAIPNSMNTLQPLWDNGQMRVINSVGYPDQSLSHFTGADIMASGNSDPSVNSDGWLARYYTELNPLYRENLISDPPAVKIGGPTSILFNDMDKIDISANFASASRLEEFAKTGVIYNHTLAPDDCYYGEQVLFLRTIANAATLYSESIFNAYNNSETEAAYGSTLGEQLKLVARLIKGGLKTQLYLVTLDGFDTHVSQNQGANHLGLLENLSSAISEFYSDLTQGNSNEDVLCMTYSEFGRRVEENGFNGTDHGAALPIMLFGNALEGNGVHGMNPDLLDLDLNGNLKHGTDFRSIYATILENWFCIGSTVVDEILGANYPRINDLGLNCISVSSRPVQKISTLHHRIHPRGQGTYNIQIKLPKDAKISIEIVSIAGQKIKSIVKGQYHHQGTHSFPFSLQELSISQVPMVYIIRMNGQQFPGKFIGSSY